MRNALVLVSLALVSTVCNAQEQHLVDFWGYVSQNEARIHDATDDDQELWTTLNRTLQAIDPDLGVRASNVVQDQKRDLIITAYANREKFQLCHSIVGQAPKYHLLNLVALMPPATSYPPYIFQFREGTVELAFHDVMVHFDDANQPPIDLVLILPPEHYQLIRANNNIDLMGFYYNLLLDMTMQVLGEQVMAEKIGSIELMPVSVIMPAVAMDKLKEFIH